MSVKARIRAAVKRGLAEEEFAILGRGFSFDAESDLSSPPLPILLSDDMLILLLLSANHVNAMELHVRGISESCSPWSGALIQPAPGKDPGQFCDLVHTGPFDEEVRSPQQASGVPV
jgi:hypothetical protein